MGNKFKFIFGLNIASLLVIFYLVAQIFGLAYVVEAPINSKTSEIYDSENYILSATTNTKLPSYVSKSAPTNSNYLYSWSEIEDYDNYSDYLSVLSNELGKYDSNFLKNIGLNKIYLVRNIIDGNENRSLGFTETISGNIYLDALESDRAYSFDSISTVHHEIGHLLTIKTLGLGGLESREWNSINSRSDYYNANVLDSKLFPQAGFVSSYAMTSIAEDMAETYAFIMMKDDNLEISSELQSDTVLLKKIEFIAQSLKSLNLVVPWLPL